MGYTARATYNLKPLMTNMTYITSQSFTRWTPPDMRICCKVLHPDFTYTDLMKVCYLFQFYGQFGMTAILNCLEWAPYLLNCCVIGLFFLFHFGLLLWRPLGVHRYVQKSESCTILNALLFLFSLVCEDGLLVPNFILSSLFYLSKKNKN